MLEIMIATIDLYEPKHDHLKVKTKRGTVKSLVHVVTIGPCVFIKPSQSSAYNFLSKMGFEFNCETGGWDHKFKSEQQKNLERNYIKCIQS